MGFAARRPTEAKLERFYVAYPRYEDVPAVTRERYREILDTFVPYRRPNRILDIGCGVGSSGGSKARRMGYIWDRVRHKNA